MKNIALLRGLYKMVSAGDTLVTFGEALGRCQQLVLANKDPDLTERVASSLLLEASNYPLPADWFINETMFEVYAASSGLQRRQVALDALNRGEITDNALDLYNARMSRFVEETSVPVSG